MGQFHRQTAERVAGIRPLRALNPSSRTLHGILANAYRSHPQSTVLLNANVAFLAIPSVDNGNGNVTAAQISSYLSIVTSVGSILLGLLLIRQHRVKSKETAEEAVSLVARRARLDRP